jgi:autotransporter-associated beta strand protein
VLAGNVALAKSTAGTVVLSAMNTYTGLTAVSSGMLVYGTNNAISTGDVTVSGGTLSLGSFSDSVGAVTLISGAILSYGGTLTSTNGFTVQSGTASIVLAGNVGLTKTTSGTVVLSGVNAYTGLTTVSTGTLAYGINNAISTGGVTISGGTLSVSGYSDLVGAVTLASGAIAGGTLTSTSGFAVQSGSASAVLAGGVGLTKATANTVVLSGVNVYAGLTTVNAGVLELAASAQGPVLGVGGSDIKAGKIVFDYSGSSPAATIQSLLAASRASGWTSGQFRSSTADASHALGWADDGLGKVTVAYALYGDTNLDGAVNGTDLNVVLSYYNTSGATWGKGDVNYDGVVNGTDLNAVLSNYNQSIGMTAGDVAVPEPGTLALLVMGAVGVMAGSAWRRQRGRSARRAERPST